MWNPFKSIKNLIIRKGTESAIKPVEGQIGEFVAYQRAQPLKGYRTILVNGGILAGATFLQFMAGIDLERDLGLSPTTALILMVIINGLLRAITTTPLGKAAPAPPKDQSSRSSALTGMIVLACLLGISQIHAQTPEIPKDYGAFLGGSIDGDGQNAAGNACAFKAIVDDSIKAASCISMRGGSDGQPVYDFSQLFLRPFAKHGKIELFAGPGGGVMTDSNSSSGLLEGGLGIVRHDLWNGMGIGALLRGTYSPGNDLPTDPDRKFKLRLSLGLTWEPENK